VNRTDIVRRRCRAAALRAVPAEVIDAAVSRVLPLLLDWRTVRYDH
jgi:hypothetical protein